MYCRYSLSLIDSLLYLADQGHYKEVLNIFSVPMQHCPEVLFLAIIRTQVRKYVCLYYFTHKKKTTQLKHVNNVIVRCINCPFRTAWGKLLFN